MRSISEIREHPRAPILRRAARHQGITVARHPLGQLSPSAPGCFSASKNSSWAESRSGLYDGEERVALSNALSDEVYVELLDEHARFSG